MTVPEKLTGTDLIDCARANAKQGVEIAAELCGYKDDPGGFQDSLKQAFHQMGVDIKSFDDLVLEQSISWKKGLEIAPESPSNL
jgi:hypothetical protein